MAVLAAWRPATAYVKGATVRPNAAQGSAPVPITRVAVSSFAAYTSARCASACVLYSSIDSMLMKWILVAYQSGDFAKAREKCNKLLFEYPESRHAETARQVLPRIEARLQ